MTLILLGLSIALLLLLIVRLKLSPFLALLLVSFSVGVLNGMSAESALRSILKGIGDTMGSLVLVIFRTSIGTLLSVMPPGWTSVFSWYILRR